MRITAKAVAHAYHCLELLPQCLVMGAGVLDQSTVQIDHVVTQIIRQRSRQHMLQMLYGLLLQIWWQIGCLQIVGSYYVMQV